MTKKNILRVKDKILRYTDRLEVLQALVFYRMDIFTTGIYSERVCLSENILSLVEEQLDSLINDFRLLVESGFVLDDVPDCPVDEM